MKFYIIVVWMFIFNVSLALIGTSGAFGEYTPGFVQDGLLNQSETDANNLNAQSNPLSTDSFAQAIGDTLSGITKFRDIFFNTILNTGWTIKMVIGGCTSDETCPKDVNAIGDAISAIMFLIYVAAFVQFISGKFFKNMS